MIEVQIKDRSLYDKVKSYANYSSDLTLVCSFRDEMAPMLKNYGVEFNEEGLNLNENKGKPILTISGRNVMKLINAPAEMLHYVGVRSEFDPTIPVAKMEEVHNLIKEGLVKRDEKFKNLYSPIGYNAKIKDLICSSVRFYGKGRLTDYVDPESTIRSLKLKDCKEKSIVYKQFNLKPYTSIMSKEKFDEFFAKDSSGNNIKLRFYNKPIILKSIAFKGNEFSICTPRVGQEGGYFLVTDPIILPKGMNMFKDISISPIGRKVPANLWRNAYYEFMYRYNANEYND